MVRGGNPLTRWGGVVPVGFGLSKCSVFHAVSTMICNVQRRKQKRNNQPREISSCVPLSRWGCPRKTLHLQGAELGGIWAVKEPRGGVGGLTPLGSMGAGTEQTPRPSSGKEPSSWMFEVKVFEVREEGRCLTMRSSHPGSDSGSHPQRGAASPRCPATSSPVPLSQDHPQ